MYKATLTPCRASSHDDTILPAAIRTIMGEHPELCSGGWLGGFNNGARFERYREEMLLPNFTDMVRDVLLDLASRRIPATGTSYGQKHASERRIGRYVTNGAFIVAALLAGYMPKHNWGPNCTFEKPQDARPHPSLCGGDYTRGWLDAEGGAA